MAARDITCDHARDLAHLRNRARDLAGFLERLHLDNLRLGDMELTIHVHGDGWELDGLAGSGIDLVRSPRLDAMTTPEGQCVSGGFAWYGSLLAQVRPEEGRR